VAFKYLTGTVVPIADRAWAESMPLEHLPTCFGCGSVNPHRLGIKAWIEGDKVMGELVFEPRFEGGPGLVHGGATAAFFDDLIGFVAMAHQKPAVTGNLHVDYLVPIPLGVTVRGEAWLTGVQDRKLYAEAAGYLPDGTRCVEVRSLFIQVGIEHFQQLAGPEATTPYRSDEYYP
jgi:acyl-coenzyme A thioesterase PaaI-like protein